jgi:glycosyltransferase involved in cell wall biosynthesis
MSRIFLSTPLRNERANLDRLVSAVRAQSIPLNCWVIVENGSTDGSKEYLEKLQPCATIREIVVLNIGTETAAYQLGSKYARIVARGFAEICNRHEIEANDLIGILDADSFPEERYYEKLIGAFRREPQLGITSGRSRDLDTGEPSAHSENWVRGSCRLWRGACFLQSGYIIGPSADTLSAARAELDGWLVEVTPDALFYAREIGERSKYLYYGESAYFRGNTFPYAVLRCAALTARRRPSHGFGFLAGYAKAYASSAPRIQDPALFSHFRRYNWRLLKRYLRGSGDAARG